jgi:O-antigen/teichoic acid export membrane protein
VYLLGQRQFERSRRLLERLRRSSVFINLLSVSGATVAGRLISLVVLGYPARVLGPEKFGMIGFGLSVTAYANILLSPGLVVWGTRAVARDRSRAGEILVTVRFIQLLLASLSYGALATYCWCFLKSSEERGVVLLCGLALFNAALSVDWVFNGLELMRVPASLGVVTALVNVAGLLVFVHSPKDIYHCALVAPAAVFINILLGYSLLVRRVRPAWPGLRATKAAAVASLPLGVTMALIVVLHYANNFIVKAYLGSAALGIFLAAYRLVELASTLPGLVSTVFLPRLARLALEDAAAAQRQARQFALLLIVAGAFVAALTWVEAPAIVSVLYGTRYLTAVALLRLMAVAVFFNFAICGYTNAMISYGKDHVMMLAVAVSTVVSVGGGLLLVPRLGTTGAALVIAGIDLSGWLVSLPCYHRTIGSLHFKAWMRPLLGAAATVLLSSVLQKAGVPFLARVPLAVLVYSIFTAQEIGGILR